MIRIEIDALEIKDGLYFLHREIFHGIGYEVSEPSVLAAYRFEQGQRSAKLDSAILPGQEASGVTSDFIEPHEENYDGEPVSFNGQPYTGLAYEFRNHHCVSEELYVDGSLKRAITWYQSGNIATYEIWDEAVTQDVAWFVNGQPKSVEYAEKDVFRMGFNFNEQGQTTSIRIFGAYFRRLNALKDKLKVAYLDLDYVRSQLSADESIFVGGDAINDDILQALFDSGGLAGVKTIHLFNTSISGESIDLLSRLKNLEHIMVEYEDNKDIKDALLRLKRQQPSLKIDLNRAPLPSHS